MTPFVEALVLDLSRLPAPVCACELRQKVQAPTSVSSRRTRVFFFFVVTGRRGGLTLAPLFPDESARANLQSVPSPSPSPRPSSRRSRFTRNPAVEFRLREGERERQVCCYGRNGFPRPKGLGFEGRKPKQGNRRVASGGERQSIASRPEAKNRQLSHTTTAHTTTTPHHTTTPPPHTHPTPPTTRIDSSNPQIAPSNPGGDDQFGLCGRQHGGQVGASTLSTQKRERISLRIGGGGGGVCCGGCGVGRALRLENGGPRFSPSPLDTTRLPTHHRSPPLHSIASPIPPVSIHALPNSPSPYRWTWEQ